MKKSLADMVRSLGLMAVVIAAVLFVGGRYLVHPGAADQAAPVDYSGVVSGFHDEARVAPLAPASLPSSWRANAARLLAPRPDTTQLHIGWALPKARYAGLDEATGAAGALVAGVLGDRGRTVTGTTTIAGARWDVRTSDRGERAYTRGVGRVTVVVTGNATHGELRMLAGSLR